MQLDKPGTEKIRKARDDREMQALMQAFTDKHSGYESRSKRTLSAQ
jgi:hypothetical protein